MKAFAAEEANTKDIRRCKLVSIRWWAFRDSNPGPTGYEPAALPTELTVHFRSIAATIS